MNKAGRDLEVICIVLWGNDKQTEVKGAKVHICELVDGKIGKVNLDQKWRTDQNDKLSDLILKVM